jgi:hypothetical protein
MGEPYLVDEKTNREKKLKKAYFELNGVPVEHI